MELSNARFKDYENFKDVFKKDVEPILDRINNAYMGNPINPSQVGAVVPEQVLSQVEVNNVPYRRNGVINSPSYQETSNRRNRNGEQIDCEVLFLTDSNLHKMNVDIMNHGTDAQKIFCLQFKDIEYIIENATTKRKPSKIYTQCGTNDFENVNIDEMKGRMNNIITAISSNILSEDGEIIISSILPRADHMDKVKRFNDFLITIPRSNRLVNVMRNYNITEQATGNIWDSKVFVYS